MSESFYTVSELNQYIKDVINAGFPQTMWICGEIQQYDRNRGKRHVFFELVEKDPESSDIVARIGLVIFANRKFTIEGLLKKSENAFELKDDIEVKFECKVDFYAPHGAVRLVVENIDPTYTLGKLAQEKQKLIAQLKKEGVFEKNKQLDLTRVPLRLGLITAQDSAAYNDFISELSKSGQGFQVFLRNTIMQGKNCETDVCRGLEILSTYPLDAVVITRGGGSLADLSCFDSKLIACKIAGMKVPVLTGIGHEINTSITDLCAHTSAKTPTAIAQFLVNTLEEFVAEIDGCQQTIVDLALDLIEREKAGLKNRAGRLHNSTVSYLKEHHAKMIRYSEVLKQRPRGVLANALKELDGYARLLPKISEAYLQRMRQQIEGFSKILDIVDPVNTLKRGFSLTRLSTGEIVKDIAQVSPGTVIETEVVNGRIKSSVMEGKL